MSPDRLTWNLAGRRLDAEVRAALAEHAFRWQTKLPGFALRVPAGDAVGVIGWGSIALDEPAPARLLSTAKPGSVAHRVAAVLDALAELEQLGLEVTVMAAATAYRRGPLGFEPAPRAPGERLLVEDAPAAWAEVTPVAPTPEPLPAVPAPRDDDGGELQLLRARLDAMPADVRDALAGDHRITTIGAGLGLAIVAGYRDRPRGEDLQAHYATFVEVLGQIGDDDLAPTLALVLAAGDGPRTAAWASQVCRTLRRHPLTRPLLLAVADLPGFAVAAAGAYAGVTRQRFRLDELEPWLAHPFWKARVEAIMTVPDIDLRARVACSVWHTIDRAALPVDVEPFSYLAGLRVPPHPRDWVAAAAPYGGLIELPPLPTLDEGARSRCADLRAWCVERGARAPDEPPPPERLVLDDATRDRLRAAELDAVAAAGPRVEEAVAWLQANVPGEDAP